MPRILVIDDSDLVRKLLHDGLSAAGFEVSVALDANQGYEVALTTRPDLILLDIQLPDVTGFELCRVIRNRAELQHIPIIMITGTAHRTEEKVRGFQAGADDYVQKPFEIEELVERVRAILRRKTAALAMTDQPAELMPANAHAPTPGAAPTALESVLEAPTAPTVQINLSDSITLALRAPAAYPPSQPLPAIAFVVLIMANVLTLLGIVAAAGPTVKPLAGVLLASTAWGLSVSVVVIVSSLAGIRLGWREGARLLSVASLPILLRLVGGVAFALITTLSPFAFSSGVALFIAAPPRWIDALDLSVLWSVYLCAKLLQTRAPESGRRPWIVAGCLWLLIVLLSAMVRAYA